MILKNVREWKNVKHAVARGYFYKLYRTSTSSLYSFTHFSQMSHFYTPRKRQKTYGSKIAFSKAATGGVL